MFHLRSHAVKEQSARIFCAKDTFFNKINKNFTPFKYTKLFINNEWVDSKSGKTFATYNPATGEKICDVAEGDAADIDLAVAAAKKAFAHKSTYRNMDASKRGELLWKLADLIEQNQVFIRNFM